MCIDHVSDFVAWSIESIVEARGDRNRDVEYRATAWLLSACSVAPEYMQRNAYLFAGSGSHREKPGSVRSGLSGNLALPGSGLENSRLNQVCNADHDRSGSCDCSVRSEQVIRLNVESKLSP